MIFREPNWSAGLRGRRRRPASKQLKIELLEPRQMLSVNVLTWHNDLTRQGLNSAEVVAHAGQRQHRLVRQTVFVSRAGTDLRRAALRLEPGDPGPRNSQRRFRGHGEQRRLRLRRGQQQRAQPPACCGM